MITSRLHCPRNSSGEGRGQNDKRQWKWQERMSGVMWTAHFSVFGLSRVPDAVAVRNREYWREEKQGGEIFLELTWLAGSADHTVFNSPSHIGNCDILSRARTPRDNL